ncbi:hypothetical protein [Nocardia sp. NPDC004604]|uniref:hypothetical protein n=1 Tax=Nocardia sp. NPDC004604 TaxID=3157013 RepID=UPI0033B4976E
MVDLDVAYGATEFPDVRKEPGEDLLVRMVDPDRLGVSDSRRFLPMQRCLAEPCDEWFSALAFDACFDTGA